VTRGRLLATSGLSLVGAGVATYLTTLHVRHVGTGAASSCNFGGPFNCDVVNTSEYSAVLGVPVSHFALLLYLLCFLLAVTGLRSSGERAEKERARLHLLLLALAAMAAGVSLGLAYVSVFVLKALCAFCTVLYAVNLLLLGVSLPGASAALRTAAASEPGGAIVSTLRALRAPGLAGILVGLLCGFVFSAAHLRQHLGALHQRPAQKSAQTTDQKSEQKSEQKSDAAQKELVASLDAPRVDLVTQTAPSLGPATAPITIVEVSDFECPYCRRAAATLKELLPLYPGKLRVVFRHFPLDQACNPLLTRPLHEHACDAARAAVCVAERDPSRFFAFAEKLFTGETDPESISQAITGVGLKAEEIAACAKGQAAADRVARDIRECNAAGVRAVPVLFINGRAVRGALSLEVYKQVIDEELQRAASQR
jgi:protein-disulfide isomerase/uncharacterized membrane protein